MLRRLVSQGVIDRDEAFAAYIAMIEGGGFLPTLAAEFFDP
jgi:hypothetical protein